MTLPHNKKVNSLRDEREALENERKALHYKYQEIENTLSSMGRVTGLSDEKAKKRDALLQAKHQYITRFADIKKRLNEIHSEEDKILKNILKEIFTPQQLKQIYAEQDRRCRGEASVSLPMSATEPRDNPEFVTSRKLCQQLVDKMLKARQAMNSVMMTGCSRFGESDFIQTVSPVNRELLPIIELEKLKRIHNLK